MVYFDNYGKHSVSTFGATFLGEFMDGATGWGIGYGMTTKKSMVAGLGKYIAFMKSHNHTVKKACCDDASEVGSRFADAAREVAYRAGQLWFREAAEVHGIEVIKMAPEMQRQNKEERTHQTWKTDAACMMAS